MKYRVLIPALLGAAFTIAACENPAPTELPKDLTPSLSAAPKKATPIEAVVDLSGPIPGFPNVINPECITVDAGTGKLHFKNCIVLGTMTGDLAGDVTAILNGWQNLATLASVARGHFTLNACHADFGCGAFDGPHKGEAVPGGQATLRGNGHGTGDFHTLQLRFTIVERGNTQIFDLDGVIF
jgi:hypothetical protein